MKPIIQDSNEIERYLLDSKAAFCIQSKGIHILHDQRIITKRNLLSFALNFQPNQTAPTTSSYPLRAPCHPTQSTRTSNLDSRNHQPTRNRVTSTMRQQPGEQTGAKCPKCKSHMHRRRAAGLRNDSGNWIVNKMKRKSTWGPGLYPHGSLVQLVPNGIYDYFQVLSTAFKCGPRAWLDETSKQCYGTNDLQADKWRARWS